MVINAYNNWLKIKDVKIYDKLLKMSDNEKELAFSSNLTFGTAGMRGEMKLGTAGLNEVNICKLATAVGIYCQNNNLSRVSIGFDTRHNSKTYSRIFAKVLAKYNINVNLFKNFVPTPILIYSISQTNSDLGIMITASHNNKRYNGVKISTSELIQISGDAEKQIFNLYNKLDEIQEYNKFLTYKDKSSKLIKYIPEKVKKNFLGAFYKNKLNKVLNIIYTPLNGTAYKYVLKALKGVGFKKIVTPFSQKYPNGSFATCPSPNPEYEVAFKKALKCTEMFDADIIVATDPDGDRFGVMIKSTKGYKLLTGNEVGFLLLNYLYENREQEENLFAISTVVSSPMFFKMCEEYNIKYKKTLTGFKNLGKAKIELENKLGKDGFIMAYEESCGYVVKDNLYDKDAVFALLRFCEMASYLKNQGSSVEECLDDIYTKFGNIYSLNSSISFEGTNAFERMNNKIDEIREKGVNTLMRKKIIKITDYLKDKTGLDKSNFIEYETQDFTFIIRPSGTEPKLKVYIHAKGKTLDQSKKLANSVLVAVKKEIFGLDEQ